MFIPVLKINTSVKINILSLFLEVLLGIILYFVSLLVLKPTNLKEIKKFLNEFTKNLLNSTKRIILFWVLATTAIATILIIFWMNQCILFHCLYLSLYIFLLCSTFTHKSNYQRKISIELRLDACVAGNKPKNIPTVEETPKASKKLPNVTIAWMW